MIPREMKEVLECPKCGGGVTEEEQFLICANCRLAYPVLDGDVPDLQIKDAWPLGKAKAAKFRQRLKL